MTATAGRLRLVDRDDRPLVAGPLARWSSSTAWITVIGLSALVGVVMSRSAMLATAHMGLVCLAVVVVALAARTPDLPLGVTVYAGLCDVLWRSSSAQGPYELSKYALIFGFGVLAVRFVPRATFRTPCGVLVLLLVPGAVSGVMVLGLSTGREYLVANLAGLVALAAAVWGCGNLRLTSAEVRGLYLFALSPIASVAAQATLSTADAEAIDFSDDVNFLTSGGFGPNQVSSMLCFGGLLCLLVLLQRSATRGTRALALVTAVWLVGQAMLTFSRGGLFGLVLAGGAIVLAAMTSAGQRGRVVTVAAIVIVAASLLLSWVGAFTGGASDDRFTNTNSTNRTEIARDDLEIFANNPLGGVGVGRAKDVRREWRGVAPHTEFSRLPAEHGLAGVGVLIVLGWLCVRLVVRARGWNRMATAGLLVMALAQMAHSATRIGSIAVAFGLAALIVDDDADPPR